MARKFSELEKQMNPESRSRAKARAKEQIAEMLLSEIRQSSGLTQEELAKALGIKQPSLSRLEAQHDVQVSTLSRLIHALGGKLEIIARLPGGTIRITQFDDAA
jgi:DNA-binding XRE family transcriptional regulator